MVQITIRSESFQRREVRLAISLLPPFHPSPSTAVAPMALHNITYVSPDCRLGNGGGHTTNTPLLLRLGGGGGGILRSPAWDFPVLLSGHGKRVSGLCATVGGGMRLWTKPPGGRRCSVGSSPGLCSPLSRGCC